MPSKANKKRDDDKESLKNWVKKAIDLIVHKQISQTVILSSYKINTVLKEHFGIDVRVDRIGRILSNYAKQKNLKRLPTNIPKYKLSVKDYLKEEERNRDNKENKENNKEKEDIADNESK